MISIFRRITGFLAAGVTTVLFACAGSGAMATDSGSGTAPTYATSGLAGLLASLLPSGDNVFAAISSAHVIDWDADEVAATDDIAVVHIMSDGDNGFMVTVLDRTNAVQRTIHFPADSFVTYDDGVRGEYVVRVTEGLNSYRFKLFARRGDFDDAERTDGSPWHDYATVFEFREDRSGLEAFFAFGARTPAGGLPYAGTAVYEGWLNVRSFATDLSDEYDYGGSLRLEADFAEGAVSGMVDNMRSSSHGGDWVRSDMPDGNRMDILNGRIANGRLVADWEGHGPEGAPADTMRGFSGTVKGIFHGPAAEELAGVLEGRREATDDVPAQIAIGEFVAGRGDVDTEKPVGRLADLLPSGDNGFPAVSSALARNSDAGEITARDDIAVVHVASDGDNGFMVTVLDRTNAVQRTIHFPADSFVPDDDGVGGKYEVTVTEGLNRYRFRLRDRKDDFDDAERTDGSPDHDYATVFEFEERNSGLGVYFAFGTGTPAGGLPNAGTAVYRGWLSVRSYPTDYSDSYSYGGDLRLEADFAEGTVSGTVDRMGSSSRGGDWVWSDMPDGNRMDILNGRISDGRLAADWEGHGPEGAPAETMRGFSGTVTAVFHGPAAEELAGVLEGRREATDDAPAQVAIGEFVAEGEGVFETVGDLVGREAAPTYAATGPAGLLASLLPSGDNGFPVVFSGVFEDFDAGEAVKSDDIAVVHVMSDGDNGFIVTVLDRAEGEEFAFHFPADSFVPGEDGGRGRYEVELSDDRDSFRFRLYSRKGDFDDAERTDGSPWHDYATVFEFQERNSGLKAYFAFGARTPAGGLPYAGTAVYRGRLRIDSPATDLSERYRYGGELRLEADFAEGAVSGMVDDMESRVSGGSWSDMPEGNRMDILNGRIADGRLAADWEGHGPESDPLETMRGFSGTFTGIFHGPAAEELAGVLEGRREATDDAPAQVAIGEFMTERGDVDTEPVGLLADLLPSGNHTFPAVSATLLEEGPDDEAAVIEGFVVQHVASDGAGGFRVTILGTDDAVQRTVHFPADSFEPYDNGDGGSYEVEFTEGLYSYAFGLHARKDDFEDAERTDGSPDHAYATVFELREYNTDLRAYFAFGAGTPAGGLPNAGTAIYSGWLGMRSFATDLSDEYGYGGDLRLEADFGAGTVSGTVDDMSSDSRSRSWSDMPDGNRMDILNGRISGGRLVADWEGHGPEAEPVDTMRGFAGTVKGIFHGPGGEELAGVLEGRREATGNAPAQVAIGEFVAERGDGVFLSVSDVQANTRDPVYAADGTGSVWDRAGVDLGVASVSRLRDLRNLRERLTEPAAGSAEVRSVSPDGDGGGGYTVTYVIDGTEHDIHFGRNDDGSHDSVTSDGVVYDFWNGGRDGEYRDAFYSGVENRKRLK